MNLIILTDKDCISENRYVLNDKRSEHIRNILKLSVGDTVGIGLLNGPVGKALIETCTGNEISLKTLELTSLQKKKPIIDLICALPRPQTLKKILFSSAMMNIRQIHLVRANRVEKSYYQSPLLDEVNYTPFMMEGLAQGRNTILPEVFIHQKFRPFFEDELERLESRLNNKKSIKLLPKLESNTNLTEIYQESFKHIFLSVGPEGGWVPFEEELMQNLGFQTFSLGSWTLRVEHALVAVLSQIEIL